MFLVDKLSSTEQKHATLLLLSSVDFLLRQLLPERIIFTVLKPCCIAKVPHPKGMVTVK